MITDKTKIIKIMLKNVGEKTGEKKKTTILFFHCHLFHIFEASSSRCGSIDFCLFICALRLETRELSIK